MDRPEKQNRKVKRRPRVPLKTYKWEDVYRSRRKGGYPWTHLYKEPFDEELDPEEYTMEALRRSKSSSTFDKSERSDGVEIEEIFDDNKSNISAMDSTKHTIEITEPDFDSKSDRLIAETKRSQMFTIESADSSDNISQYLDKEDRGPQKEDTSVTAEETDDIPPPRANSEEPPRKRKLSGESSYSKISRLSLPKFAALKKLSKQKLPKLSFPTSNIKKSKTPKKASPPQVKKEAKHKSSDFKNVKPVYIHIPLKPPPGESDQFSYLEFEEKPKPSTTEEDLTSKEDVSEEPQSSEAPPSFRSLVKALKKEQDAQKAKAQRNEEHIEETIEPTTSIKEDIEVIDCTLQEPDDDEQEEIVMQEPNDKTTEASKCEVVDVLLKSDVEMKEEATPKKISSMDVDETEPESDMSSNHEHDVFDKLFDAGATKELEFSQLPPIKKDVRAKSAEPERKRKMSLESSYSRKSLSKLAFLKKIKDAKNKIKFPSLSNLISRKPKEKPPVKDEMDDGEEKKKTKPSTSKKDKLTHAKHVEPVYIHIPLKPPEGHTDEFSHLETQKEPVTTMEVENPEEESPIVGSPDSAQASGVHFIFLTAPSDDEILDGPDVPETPLSETKFFSTPIDELKELAKEVVNEISPETKKQLLDPVEEEANEEKIEEFDREDGLKITDAELAQSEQVKSSLKQEGSPLLKKKVSFKRRSKTDSKDGVYEEVIPKDDVMAVSEMVPETTAKDEVEKVEEDACPDETARWSKISDHEYEPINPPPEEKEPSKPPPHVVFQENIEEAPVEQDNLGSSPNALTETEVTVTTHETPLPTFASSLSSKGSQPPDDSDLEDKDALPKQNKLQSTLKLKADQFKNKLQSIKKPHITLPNRPKFHKPNLQKLKLNLPKIPDTTRINLPSFSKSTTKVTIKQRQDSTESNVGDSKKHTFTDFKSRLFKRKHDDDHDLDDPSQITSSGETGRSKSVERSAGYDASGESQSDANTADSKKHTFDFSTFPRFFKRNRSDNKAKKPVYESYEPKKRKSPERSVIRVPLHSEESMDNGYDLKTSDDRMENYVVDDPENINSPSLIRYNEDIDIDDDDYIRDNMEIPDEGYKNRWHHGHFSNKVTDLDSPESLNNQNESFDLSVNTDIHSSQSSLDIRRRGVLEEINSDEFFLRQKGISQDNIEVGKYLSSEIREAFKEPVNTLSDLQTYGSNQSLPEAPKKKPARKPRRKKTPHTSQDEIKYDFDLEDVKVKPSKPKRTGSKQKNIDVLDEQDIQEIMSRYTTDEEKPYYENEKMRGKEQPNIYIENMSEDYKVNYAGDFNRGPEAPPRRQRSLKSLNLSEHESILGDFGGKHIEPDMASYVEEEIDEENRYFKEKYNTYPPPLSENEAPVRPKRRSKARKSPQTRSSSQLKSILQEPEPVVEEICVKDLRDSMGYAIIDKSKARDPPLPAPRTPPRRRRSIKSISSDKFSTVPRSAEGEPPTRPLRNYSTLGQIRSSRKDSLKSENDKENIDITQYIEIDDGNRNLVSGEILQKMRDRPLPAPPRPPRKSRVLKDITSEQNVSILGVENETDLPDKSAVEEIDMSTQTEPLPDDFVCEEDSDVVHRQIISTPTHYTYEETITHGSLLVEPLNGAKILRDEELSRNERTIPITLDSDDDDYESKIPEDFKLLKDPETQAKPILSPDEPIQDLEVTRLRVNELLADKIIVADIESENIQVNQLSGKSGVIKIGDIELPPNVVQEILRNVPSPQTAQEATNENLNDEHKILKDLLSSDTEQLRIAEENIIDETPTLIEEDLNIDIEVREEAPEYDSPDHSISAQVDAQKNENEPLTDAESEKNIPPTPPPRTSESLRVAQEESIPRRPPRQNKTDNSDVNTPLGEPDIDDYPPPRPPQPDVGYMPSQPPASFYALRAQKYVSEDIPAAPRRRRHHRHVSRSTSEESVAIPPSRKHYRSPEPTISQLTGQLIRACGSAGNSALKRLIAHIKDNIIRNEDGQQDLHVVMIILLVLIAGLLLLGIGDEKTVVHLHHWEYFNPPKDM